MRVNGGVEGRQLAEFTLLLQDFEIYITGAAIVLELIRGHSKALEILEETSDIC